MLPISRRLFLAGSAAVVVGACSGNDDTSSPTTPGDIAAGEATDPTASPTEPQTIETQPEPIVTEPAIVLSADPFQLGVASGDPDANSVILWTRLLLDAADVGNDITVSWLAGTAEDGSDLTERGTVTALEADGHSVHVVADLGPGEWYYRFDAGGFSSPVGRTVIAAPDAAQAVFVSASCQNYAQGLFTTHADIAVQKPDFVAFLGDYIYEGAGAEPDGTLTVRSHETPEPTDLAAYRTRYELYKRDADLQAAHAACPWFVIWDDHEVENNYAGLSPQDPVDAAGFQERRFAAYTAWWEHMPVRLPKPSAADGDYTIYRAATWGDLVGISLLDGRQYRTDQACDDVRLSLDPPCAETFDEARTMLGDQQEAFLADTFGNQGTVWNVIGQQTVFSDITIAGAILNYDQWDGYPGQRSRIVGRMADNAIPNVVVLTGDIHLAGIAHLRGAPTDAANLGVEFVATSVASNGNVDGSLTDILTALPTLVAAELDHRGYILHTVTRDRWQADYRIIDTVKTAGGSASTWASFEVPAGTNTVTQIA